jgi:hypothetical protein
MMLKKNAAHFLVDLTSACVDKMRSSENAAEYTVKEFEKMDYQDLVQEFVSVFSGAWELSEEQISIIAEWPREQIHLLHAIVVAAANLRMTNVQVRPVIRAVAGYPRSTTISLDENGGMMIVYTSPDAG